MSDETKADKPRGACTGCRFEYQLGTARSGEFKGELVIRKHNSRTGPGLCEGAQKPPVVPESLGVCAEAECRLNDGHLGGHSLTRASLDLPHDTGAACMHPHGFPYADDGNGHSGSVCPDCGFPEPKYGCSLGAGHEGLCDGQPCCEPDQAPAPDAPFADPAYEPSGAPVPGVDTITFVDPVATTLSLTSPLVAESFVDPAPMPAELPPVSGQPEPDRDRWGRYVLPGVDGSKVGHTRATTFAKLGSSTYSIQEWQKRMVVKGLTERPDLLALAHGKDVKRDKKELNRIAEDAATHAGNKVAANIGTAYHAFTERLDAGLMTLADVPVQYRARCEQYLDAIRAHGIVTRPEWMERTTAVRSDQVSAPAPVAGTLDRIWQLPNGELVIGDLKTGSDLSYGWAEIAVQLALYAHGCNTFGLFDWNTRTWQALDRTVRTDFAIVMHLPADGDGCTLYRIDLVKGWKYAQVSGEVQTRQKDKSVAGVLVPGSLGPVTAVESAPVAAPRDLNPVISGNAVSVLQAIPVAAPEATFAEMERAMRVVTSTVDPNALAGLYDYAVAAGKFSAAQLDQIKHACRMQWDALNIPY